MDPGVMRCRYKETVQKSELYFFDSPSIVTRGGVDYIEKNLGVLLNISGKDHAFTCEENEGIHYISRLEEEDITRVRNLLNSEKKRGFELENEHLSFVKEMMNYPQGILSHELYLPFSRLITRIPLEYRFSARGFAIL